MIKGRIVRALVGAALIVPAVLGVAVQQPASANTLVDCMLWEDFDPPCWKYQEEKIKRGGYFPLYSGHDYIPGDRVLTWELIGSEEPPSGPGMYSTWRWMKDELGSWDDVYALMKAGGVGSCYPFLHEDNSHDFSGVSCFHW